MAGQGQEQQFINFIPMSEFIEKYDNKLASYRYNTRLVDPKTKQIYLIIKKYAPHPDGDVQRMHIINIADRTDQYENKLVDILVEDEWLISEPESYVKPIKKDAPTKKETKKEERADVKMTKQKTLTPKETFTKVETFPRMKEESQFIIKVLQSKSQKTLFRDFLIDLKVSEDDFSQLIKPGVVVVALTGKNKPANLLYVHEYDKQNRRINLAYTIDPIKPKQEGKYNFVHGYAILIPDEELVGGLYRTLAQTNPEQIRFLRKYAGSKEIISVGEPVKTTGKRGKVTEEIDIFGLGGEEPEEPEGGEYEEIVVTEIGKEIEVPVEQKRYTPSLAIEEHWIEQAEKSRKGALTEYYFPNYPKQTPDKAFLIYTYNQSKKEPERLAWFRYREGDDLVSKYAIFTGRSYACTTVATQLANPRQIPIAWISDPCWRLWWYMKKNRDYRQDKDNKRITANPHGLGTPVVIVSTTDIEDMKNDPDHIRQTCVPTYVDVAAGGGWSPVMPGTPIFVFEHTTRRSIKNFLRKHPELGVVKDEECEPKYPHGRPPLTEEEKVARKEEEKGEKKEAKKKKKAKKEVAEALILEPEEEEVEVEVSETVKKELRKGILSKEVFEWIEDATKMEKVKSAEDRLAKLENEEMGLLFHACQMMIIKNIETTQKGATNYCTKKYGDLIRKLAGMVVDVIIETHGLKPKIVNNARHKARQALLYQIVKDHPSAKTAPEPPAEEEKKDGDVDAQLKKLIEERNRIDRQIAHARGDIYKELLKRTDEEVGKISAMEYAETPEGGEIEITDWSTYESVKIPIPAKKYKTVKDLVVTKHVHGGFKVYFSNDVEDIVHDSIAQVLGVDDPSKFLWTLRPSDIEGYDQVWETTLRRETTKSNEWTIFGGRIRPLTLIAYLRANVPDEKIFITWTEGIDLG